MLLGIGSFKPHNDAVLHQVAKEHLSLPVRNAMLDSITVVSRLFIIAKHSVLGYVIIN